MGRLLAIIGAVAVALGLAVGAQGAAAAPAAAIVGPGQGLPGNAPAVQADWPFVAAVYAGHHFCTGQVVATRWVSTAAHCVYDTVAAATVTYPGAYRLSAPGPQMPADTLRVHPSWNPTTAAWDFALVRLASPTTAPAVPLPAPSDDSALAAAQADGTATGVLNGRIAGWGLVTPGGASQPDVLQAIPGGIAPAGIPLRTDAECAGFWGADFQAASMACAGNTPAGSPAPRWSACSGDSGGPLMTAVNGRQVLFGTTSWGSDPCGDVNAPGVYARVPAARDWICDTITSPTAMTATASARQVVVAWAPDATTCAWRDPTVDVTASPGGAVMSVPLSAGGATFTGLADDTTYTFSAVVRSAVGATPPPAMASALTSAAPQPTACGPTFYQQDARTWRNQAAPDGTSAVRVVSRLRIFRDTQAACRVNLTFIFANTRTGGRVIQLPGSTLGYRVLQGKNFNAPVISWPTDGEFRFPGGDPSGQDRVNARLVLVSFLKRVRSMPPQSAVTLQVVRRVPADPDRAQGADNPLFAQVNALGTGVGWAVVS